MYVSFPGKDEDVALYALLVGLIRLIERVELLELEPHVVNAIVNQLAIRSV